MEEKTIILTGNPNTGKTTIFNALTGMHQKTGNWPGVTVEIKEGYYMHEGVKYKIIDLPGTYSLTSFTEDEKIARDILVKERADTVVVIVDSSNLERNMYLITLLMELEQKIVVALNMSDIAKKKGLTVNVEKLSEFLKVEIIQTVGNRNEGIDLLRKAINKSAAGQAKPSLRINYGDRIESHILKIEQDILKDISSPYPARFFAISLIEKDPEFLSMIDKKGLSAGLNAITAEIDESYPDIQEYMIEKRYGFIHGLTKECTKAAGRIEQKIELTTRLDKIFTHNISGTLIFFIFMWATFQIVFSIGNPFAEFLGKFFAAAGEKLGSLFAMLHFPEWFISLFTNGIVSGVGSVVVFLPNIFLLFLVFSALEDSGYISRAAFVADKVMHKIGLHGKSAIPMILGFGCNVPAIMATRTLETKKDRIVTILALPFMSCAARLPVYLLFTGIFFRNNHGTILFSLYITGILVGMLSAKLFKNIFFRHEFTHIIMELPPYHIPDIKSMLISAWQKSYLFLRKAGTFIFAGVVLVWFLSYFPPSAEFAGKESYTGLIGRFIAPALKPAGFGYWQAGVALLSGLFAKELVVGTLGTLLGSGKSLHAGLLTMFAPVSAYAFMLMTLLYIPCIAAVAVIRQEAGTKWALLSTAWSIFAGWTIAVIFYRVAIIF